MGIRTGLAVAVTFWAGSAWAVVLHPGGADPANRPPDAWLGRWANNASAVVVGPSVVLTTAHQGGGVGSTVVVNGAAHTAVQRLDTLPLSDDLRLFRVELGGSPGTPANFATWAPLHLGTSEAGLATVIGGFGRGRGADLQTAGSTYGYAWGAGGNTTLRWGANVIDSVGVVPGPGPFTPAAIVADFDGPGSPSSVADEAIPAEFDSGGGFFVQVGTQWQLAGLTHDVERLSQAWFNNDLSPLTPDPDRMLAVRVSSYASALAPLVPEPTSLGTMACAATLGSLCRGGRIRCRP